MRKLFTVFAVVFCVGSGLGMRDGCKDRQRSADDRTRDAFFSGLEIVDDGASLFLRFACGAHPVEFDPDTRRIRDAFTPPSPNTTVTRLTPSFQASALAALENGFRNKTTLMKAKAIARPRWIAVAFGWLTGFEVGRRITRPAPASCDSAAVQALAHGPASWSDATRYAFWLTWARWSIEYDSGEPHYEAINPDRFSIKTASDAQLAEFTELDPKWDSAMTKTADFTSADLRLASKFRDWLRIEISKNPRLYETDRKFKLIDMAEFR